jgi:Xaa-Pro aminopeptidase
MFSPRTYIDRRKRLQKDVASGILLFLGNDDYGMNYADNTYHFRQDSTFLYFFGSDYAGLSAIIDIDNNEEIIFGDELTIDHIVWMGTQPTVCEKSQQVGVNRTEPTSRLPELLRDAIRKGRKVHFLPPYRAEHQLKLMGLLGIVPNKQAEAASVDFIKAVVNQRNYKTEEEIIQIEEAVNITADMHIHAMRMARPGMKEAEIAAAVTEIALANEGNLSFPVIATINGQTLHNHYQEGK